MSSAPVHFVWNGEAMIPASRYHQIKCDEEFVVGMRYALVEMHEQSDSSRGHYFATLKTAWQTLPDDLMEIYPTQEHLRKKALIRKGYRDEREHVCATKAEAERLVKELKGLDDYAIIQASDNVVRIWTAKSQSKRAMGAAEFQRSKQDVLEFVAGVLGVTADELARSESA